MCQGERWIPSGNNQGQDGLTDLVGRFVDPLDVLRDSFDGLFGVRLAKEARPDLDIRQDLGLVCAIMQKTCLVQLFALLVCSDRLEQIVHVFACQSVIDTAL